MATPELDRLIVEHLADIDAAAKRLYALQGEIFEALGAAAEDWAGKNGWLGKFDYLNEEFWLAPADWRTPGTEEEDNVFQAWFQMELGAGDTDSSGKPEEDFFYLTRLCRVGSGEIGFRFKQDLITKGQWRRRFRDLAGRAENTAFVVDREPSFFLPVQLEGTKLAASLQEEAIEAALPPFEDILTRIIDAKPTFDAIIAAIKPRDEKE